MQIDFINNTTCNFNLFHKQRQQPSQTIEKKTQKPAVLPFLVAYGSCGGLWRAMVFNTINNTHKKHLFYVTILLLNNNNHNRNTQKKQEKKTHLYSFIKDKR